VVCGSWGRPGLRLLAQVTTAGISERHRLLLPLWALVAVRVGDDAAHASPIAVLRAGRPVALRPLHGPRFQQPLGPAETEPRRARLAAAGLM
jgi:hypothetical protein